MLCEALGAAQVTELVEGGHSLGHGDGGGDDDGDGDSDGDGPPAATVGQVGLTFEEEVLHYAHLARKAGNITRHHTIS